MAYRPREKLNLTVDCNLLVVTAMHFLLAIDTKLQLFTFQARRAR